MADLVALIAAAHAERAVAIDWVLCQLITKGRELGELEPAAAVGVDGDWREICLPPQAWLDRLARAIEVGAFDRLEPKAIVDRILSTPGETVATSG